MTNPRQPLGLKAESETVNERTRKLGPHLDAPVRSILTHRTAGPTASDITEGQRDMRGLLDGSMLMWQGCW